MKPQRHSGTPLYRQVERELSRRLEAGELRPGDRLPTETALSEELAVNRLTVRQAIAELVRAGLLQPRQGIGTFVRDPRSTTDVTIDPTRHDVAPPAVWVAEDGISEEVVGVALAASPHASDALDAGDAPLWRVATVLAPEGQPWLTSAYWLTQERFPDLPAALAAHGSPIPALSHHYGLSLRYVWRSFAAGAATGDDAVLDVPPGSPLLLREGLNADSDGRPTVFVQRRCRSDRLRFVLHYAPAGAEEEPEPLGQ